MKALNPEVLKDMKNLSREEFFENTVLVIASEYFNKWIKLIE